MKCSADVLIVGGRIIGCSIAYFLRKQGVEVIVLERGDMARRPQVLPRDCWPPLDLSVSKTHSKRSNLLSWRVSLHHPTSGGNEWDHCRLRADWNAASPPC